MTEGVQLPESAAPAPGRTRAQNVRRVIAAVISVVVIVGIFVGVLPRIADYGEVWDTIKAMSWIEIATLLVVGMFNIITYLFVMMAVLPGLTFWQAFVVNNASTAISNTLPAGGVVGVGVTYSMYRSWGFGNDDIGRSVLVSGVWNTFVKLAMPILALALLALTGGVSAARLLAAAVGIGVLIAAVVLFTMILRSERLAQRVGNGLGRLVGYVLRLFKRPAPTTWGDAAARFRANTVELLQGRWLWLTASAVLSHTALYLVLLVALRHVGVSQAELSWVEVLATFAFVRLISALPITPGGVGVVELGYAAALVAAGEEGIEAQVVAAILVFRAITYFLPIPIGVATFLVWRAKRSWRQAPEHVAPGAV